MRIHCGIVLSNELDEAMHRDLVSTVEVIWDALEMLELKVRQRYVFKLPYEGCSSPDALFECFDEHYVEARRHVEMLERAVCGLAVNYKPQPKDGHYPLLGESQYPSPEPPDLEALVEEIVRKRVKRVLCELADNLSDAVDDEAAA
jgi:hypothetical protein